MWKGRAGGCAVVGLREKVKEVLEATRLDNAYKLDKRVEELEGVGRVVRNGAVVTGCKDPS